MSNTKATLLIRERRVLAAGFIEVVVWELPAPLAGSKHSLKYRLAFIVDGVCVLRYDNEAGKGDHRHLGPVETPFEFTSVDQLLDDFLSDVATWKAG